MIRVVAAADSSDTPGLTLSEINTALDDWVSKRSEWTADPASHQISEVSSDTDGTGTTHYVGSYRFEISDAKDNLLTKCEDKLKNKVDWYRLGYHECDHDESNKSGCSWTDKREWTSTNTSSIPADVPDF